MADEKRKITINVPEEFHHILTAHVDRLNEDVIPGDARWSLQRYIREATLEKLASDGVDTSGVPKVRKWGLREVDDPDS